MFGPVSTSEFLRDYWQQKPLFVKGAFRDFRPPVDGEDLKALATQRTAISRLILQSGGDYPWELRHGPFTQRQIDRLLSPDERWSLLVQEIDHHVVAGAQLMERFAFVPAWRMDDLMASLAPAGGGVGAHTDNYDVFLIQGIGERTWRVGAGPLSAEDEVLIDDLDVSVIDTEASRGFAWGEEYHVEPGDLLYLPPRWAHEGVALSECLTLSVGFRAPSHQDFAAALLERALSELPADAFYADPPLAPTDAPGRIDAAALAQARRIAASLLDDDQALAETFGRLVTERRRLAEADEEPDWTEADEVAAALAAGVGLVRVPGARLAYADAGEGERMLFAAGEAFHLDAALAYAAPLLADRPALGPDALRPYSGDADFHELVATLIGEGVLTLDAAGTTGG
jgi:50S ribosomal protein L16 3-hydroxylase